MAQKQDLPTGMRYSVSNLKLALNPDPGLAPALNNKTNLGPGVLTTGGGVRPQNS